MHSLSWTRVTQAPELRRSSHILSVVDDIAFVYGGELLPRQPRDGQVYALDLNGELNSREIQAQPTSPPPRVGAASATLHNAIYMFSGRGGEAMAPIEEHGALWRFIPAAQSWELVFPADPSAPYPPARSYHCSASNNKDKIFIHAGCPESGRLADLWSFDVSSRTWTQLPDAPGPARGGTSMAFHNGLLYRMNGFDGQHEQGGSLDIYNATSKTWSSKTFVADGVSGPIARSVSTLLPITISGKPCLVTLFGERDPSSLGHQGAGKMLDDVWAYDIALGTWTQISTQSPAETAKPAARGWFGADVVGQSALIVGGGLGEANERLDDVWMLQ